MTEVSVGSRGWRLEESEIFTDGGELKPLNEIPKDPRKHLICLASLVEEPCNTCCLIHGDKEVQQCRQAATVYGESREEVLLCEHHEPDFLYWFREGDGCDLVGDAVLAGAFHEWLVAGGRAPDGYDRLEYVDTEPGEFPSLPDANEIQRRLEENSIEDERINLRDYDPGVDDEDGAPLTGDDLGGADLGTNYSTR